MKLYHMIGLTTASLISLGSLAFMTNVKRVELNQDFKIENISGNLSELDGVALKGIIKTDQSNYSKVLLESDTFQMSPTTYDYFYSMDDEKLDNRELYRNAPWAKTFENDDYVITSQFDTSFPYSADVATSRLAVKNKKTNQITTTTVALKEFSSQEGRDSEYITDYNGTYYYILTTYGRMNSNSRILVYTFNPDTLRTTFKFELSSDYSGTATTDGKMLYMTGYPRHSDQLQLLSLDLETEEPKTIDLNLNIYPNQLIVKNNKLYLISDSGIYTYDASISSTEVITPSFTEELNQYDYFWIEQTIAHDNKLYILYIAYKQSHSTQYLSILDTNTNKIKFEGKIAVRSDQGLIDNYTLIVR